MWIVYSTSSRNAMSQYLHSSERSLGGAGVRGLDDTDAGNSSKDACSGAAWVVSDSLSSWGSALRPTAAELSAAAAVMCFSSSSPSVEPLELVRTERSLSWSEPLLVALPLSFSPASWFIRFCWKLHFGHWNGLERWWLRRWYSRWCLYSVTNGHFGQVSIFSGLMWLRVCSQKLSFVTATNSHCLQRNFLTWPCEFTFGLRMPSSSSLPSYEPSSQSEPASSSLVGVSSDSLGDFGGVTSIGGVWVGVREPLLVLLVLLLLLLLLSGELCRRWWNQQPRIARRSVGY
uniref:Uncharacterized protein n=1 Tax=Anopheles merus TaxID=30066 RepID=A0A182V042_ANOME